MKVQLISYTSQPEKVVATAAKLCYSNSKATDLFGSITIDEASSFIEKLSKMGHQSPLEHASFTFAIEGVSRSLLAQITRHRIASFSVQSQRYVNMDDKFDYITPAYFDNEIDLNLGFDTAMESAKKWYTLLRDQIIDKYLRKLFYNDLKKDFTYPVDDPEQTPFIALLELNGFTKDSEDEEKRNIYKAISKQYRYIEKIANENARAVLPNACPTQMIMTMNARELIHFFKERCCNRAQEEIRELAWRMFSLVNDVAPTLFANAGPSCLHGGCKEGPMTCGKPYKFNIQEYNLNRNILRLSNAPEMLQGRETQRILIREDLKDDD